MASSGAAIACAWAIPPLRAGTYSGIANVARTVVAAARSMGMTESRVLLRVEVPNAMPLILGGLRTAILQIVATATVAAYASLGGLGRYLIDGIKVREFVRLIEAAVVQWYWLEDVLPGRDQFNSIHEKLVDAWKCIGAGRPMR